MGDLGYSTEYTEDQTNRQNSMNIQKSAAIENSARNAGGQLLSEGDASVSEMLQQSTAGDFEETEEDLERYGFTGKRVALGTLGYSLVAKPDYDLS